MAAGGGDHAPPPTPEVQAALDRLHADRHARATADLVAALRSAGVDLIVLKGVGTAALLPGDEARVSADIDLLVRAGHGRRAASVLRDRGYRRDGIAPHATSWVSETETPVDVHVTLPRSSVGPRRLWVALAGHRTELEVGGSTVPVLDAPASVLHLALHTTQAGAGSRERRELALALARYDDRTWGEAARLAEAIGLASTLSSALGQVEGGESRRTALALPAVGPDAVPVRSIGERGVGPFVRSSVHPVERGRSLLAVPGRLARRHQRRPTDPAP